LCSTTTPQTPCNRQLVKLFTCCGSRSSPTGRGHGANRRRRPSCWPGSRCPQPSCSRSGRSSGSHQPAQKKERRMSIHSLPPWTIRPQLTIINVFFQATRWIWAEHYRASHKRTRTAPGCTGPQPSCRKVCRTAKLIQTGCQTHD
jgi:hypothetical protein